MAPEPGRSVGGRGRAQPGSRAHARRSRCTCCREWSPPATCPASASPKSSSTTASRSASIDVASCSNRTMSWERGVDHAGVEDPRVTYVDRLGRARDDVRRLRAARSADRRRRVTTTCVSWRATRTGAVRPTRRSGASTSTCTRTRTPLFFPEPIPGPDGEPCYAMLHRPMWHADWLGVGDALAAAGRHRRATGHLDLLRHARPPSTPTCGRSRVLRSHRCVAVGEFAFESAKIGGGPPPIRVPEGWLLIHHGVAGEVAAGFDPTAPSSAVYCAGAMLLDPDDPSRVLDRTAEPLLRAGDRRRASRHRGQRRVPDGDRGRSATASSCSTAWPTRASASPSSSARWRDRSF